jgi:hypothetical protein
MYSFLTLCIFISYTLVRSCQLKLWTTHCHPYYFLLVHQIHAPCVPSICSTAIRRHLSVCLPLFPAKTSLVLLNPHCVQPIFVRNTLESVGIAQNRVSSDYICIYFRYIMDPKEINRWGERGLDSSGPGYGRVAGLLWTRLWTFILHKIQGLFWLSEEFLKDSPPWS